MGQERQKKTTLEDSRSGVLKPKPGLQSYAPLRIRACGRGKGAFLSLIQVWPRLSINSFLQIQKRSSSYITQPFSFNLILNHLNTYFKVPENLCQIYVWNPHLHTVVPGRLIVEHGCPCCVISTQVLFPHVYFPSRVATRLCRVLSQSSDVSN